MKFSKQCEGAASEWTAHYLDYGQLKKAIHGPADAQAFVLALHREMTKVSAFAEAQAAELLQWWQTQRQPPTGTAAAPVRPGVEPARERELAACWQQFQAYLVVTAVALFKIVKKYNKKHAAKEPLDALGILRSYPHHNSHSCTQRAIRSLLTAVPPPRIEPGPQEGPGSSPLACGVCRSVFIDPVVLVCGGRFCRRCITRKLEAKRRCPACHHRHPLEVDKPAGAKWLAETIQSQVSAKARLPAASPATTPEPDPSSAPACWDATTTHSTSSSSDTASAPEVPTDRSPPLDPAPGPVAREVLTHPEATPSSKPPTTHVTVMTYLTSYPAWLHRDSTGSAPRRTVMLGAFLRAHRHVGVIALQEAFGAPTVGEQALPDHACVSDGGSGLVLFWHCRQFQVVASGVMPAGPDGRPTVLWARLEWAKGRRVKSILVVNCKAEAGDFPALEDALGQLQASQSPLQEPLLLCGHFPAAVAAELSCEGLQDCFEQRGRPVPSTAVAGPPEAWDWLLSHGALKVQRVQLVDFMYEGHAPSGHMAVYAEYMALTARSRLAPG
eukprot:EG_transcript_8394